MPTESQKESQGESPAGLEPGLWVVATPIGNLGDISARARAALGHASAILCEDTRRTSALLAGLGIGSGKSLYRFDAHAPERAIEAALERLKAGESLAYVTDAGTPGISDPGSRLVARARAEGLSVTPVPGPSAVTALLSVAGFEETSFAFRGFFPRKASERVAEIRETSASSAARVWVWFESPERVEDTLAAFAQEVPECRLVAGKELTKLHERFFAGEAREVREEVGAFIQAEGARGEWCLAALFPKQAGEHGEACESAGSAGWSKALACLLNARISASEAAKQVSQMFGVPKNAAYEKALELSGKKMPKGG